MIKILAIDDSEENLFLIENSIRILRKDWEIYTTTSALDGKKQALKILPDVIVLDVQMPVKNGFELCEEIKAIPQLKYTPIILLTAYYKDIESRVYGLEKGADAFIAKPITADEFIAHVEAMLRIKKSEDTLIAERDKFKEIVVERTREVIAGELKYRNFFEEDLSGNFVATAEGKLLDCNKAYIKLFGFDTKEAALNTSLFNLFENKTDSGKFVNNIYSHKIIENSRRKARRIDGSTVYLVENIVGNFDKNGILQSIIGYIFDDTQRTQTENALRESEERFRRAITQSPSPAMIHSEDGEVIQISKSWIEQSGYASKEIVNLSDWLEIAFCDDVENFKNYLQEIYWRIDKSGDNEFTLTTKSGKKRIWKVASALLGKMMDGRTMVITTAIDITEQKKSEKLMQNNERRLSSLLEQSKLINNSFDDIFNYSIKEAVLLSESKIGLIGIPNSRTKKIDFKASYGCTVNNDNFDIKGNPLFTKLLNEKQPQIIYSNKQLPDFEINEDVSNAKDTFLIVPLVSEDKITVLLIVGMKEEGYDKQDIQLIQLLLEGAWSLFTNRENQSKLLTAKENAEKANKLKSIFLTNMSHEVRTPMNGIIGFAELLRKEDLSLEKRRRYSEMIKKSTDDLLSVITDILEISKIETGELKIKKSNLYINAFIDEVYNKLHGSMEVAIIQNIDFKCVKSLSDSAMIYSDVEKLFKIFKNMVDNAFKFTDEGEIEIGYKLAEGGIEFYVSDTGIGIEKDKHEIIYKQFRQSDESLTRKYGGMGLGLPLAKAYVEKLGGRLNLESTVGVGSIFRFVLPVEIIEKGTNGVVPKKSKTTDGTPATILIIEDNIMNYKYIHELLQIENIETVHAKNGKEALKIFKEKPSWDLILIDLHLPDIDGINVTKKIRLTNKTVPIIAHTAFATFYDDKWFEAGCNDLIEKPFEVDDFLELIYQYIFN